MPFDPGRQRLGKTSARQVIVDLLERIDAEFDPCEAAAFVLARQALDASIALGDRLLEARALHLCGNTAAATEDTDAAVHYLDEALRIWRAHGLWREHLQTLFSLVRLLQECDEQVAANSLLKNMRDDPHAGCVDTMKMQTSAALSHLLSQDLQRAAAQTGPEVLDAARALGDPAVLSELLLVRAQVLLAVRLYQAGVETYMTSGVSRHFGHAAVQVGALDTILDEAERLPHCERLAHHLAKVRLTSAGLFNPQRDVTPALMQLTGRTLHRWPACAAAAMLIAGMLNRLNGQPAHSLTPLDKGLAIALKHGQQALVKSVLFEQSLALSKVGSHEEAYHALRNLYTLRTPWAALALQTGSTVTALRALPLRDADNDAAQSSLAGLRSVEPAHVRRAVQFIESDMARRLRVSDVATHCGVSRRTLEMVFKRSKGLTVLAFIKRRKLEAARERLENTNLPVKDIASALGYASASTLSRDFRLHFGLTPLSLRQRLPAGPRGTSSTGSTGGDHTDDTDDTA